MSAGELAVLDWTIAICWRVLICGWIVMLSACVIRAALRAFKAHVKRIADDAWLAEFDEKVRKVRLRSATQRQGEK